MSISLFGSPFLLSKSNHKGKNLMILQNTYLLNLSKSIWYLERTYLVVELKEYKNQRKLFINVNMTYTFMSTELLDLRILRLKDGIELIFKESVQYFNCGEWFTDWKWMSTWAKYSEQKETWWIFPHWLVSLNSGAKTLS